MLERLRVTEGPPREGTKFVTAPDDRIPAIMVNETPTTAVPEVRPEMRAKKAEPGAEQAPRLRAMINLVVEAVSGSLCGGHPGVRIRKIAGWRPAAPSAASAPPPPTGRLAPPCHGSDVPAGHDIPGSAPCPARPEFCGSGGTDPDLALPGTKRAPAQYDQK